MSRALKSTKQGRVDTWHVAHELITSACVYRGAAACRLLKDRKTEDHLFGDKDKFVTAAYKKKLEEDQKWLAEEKIREARDAKQDVTKAGHMGNFYRCLPCGCTSVPPEFRLSWPLPAVKQSAFRRSSQGMGECSMSMLPVSTLKVLCSCP